MSKDEAEEVFQLMLDALKNALRENREARHASAAGSRRAAELDRVGALLIASVEGVGELRIQNSRVEDECKRRVLLACVEGIVTMLEGETDALGEYTKRQRQSLGGAEACESGEK